MENNKGYVYVMINPSYEGLVKIGKTTKDPEERAKELSSATGVATPFIVVYKRVFNDCSIAESLIHNITIVAQMQATGNTRVEIVRLN